MLVRDGVSESAGRRRAGVVVRVKAWGWGRSPYVREGASTGPHLTLVTKDRTPGFSCQKGLRSESPGNSELALCSPAIG